MASSVGYREVIVDQTNTEKWTEITINTGGSQSTLQDFKVAERSGGMHYKDQTKYYTRNRCIYWRTCNQMLELVEESLDITLLNNRLRYKFTDAPVLDGVSVIEVPGAVLVLVPTVSSVHRLSFPHPDVIHKKGSSYARAGVEYTAFSILSEPNVTDTRNPNTFHVVNTSYSNCAGPQASASGLSADGQECLFALAYANGNIALVTMNFIKGTSVVHLDPQADALMPRFLSKAFSRGKSNEETVAVSMALHCLEGETYLLCVCRDGNVRAWSTQRQQCMVVADFPPDLSQGAQSHCLRTAMGVDGEMLVGVFHCYPNHSSITLLRTTSGVANQMKLTAIETIDIQKGRDIVDFAITGNLEVWMVERSATGDTAVVVYHDREFFNCDLDTRWETSEVQIDADMEPKQAYLDFLFHPGRFPVSVINKALSIYRKANIMTDVGVPTQVLKERVSAVVDDQIYGEMREREFSAEEALLLQTSAWAKFYACVMEYYESGTRPLGLIVLSHRVAPNDSSMLQKSALDHSSMSQNGYDYQEGDMITSGAVIIKKAYFSLIRPMDPVESIVLNDVISQPDQQVGVSADLVRLVSVLAYLDDNLPEDSKHNFEKSLKQLKTPLVTVSELFAKDLSAGDEDTLTSMDLLNNLAVNVEEFHDLAGSINAFLDILDVGQPELDDGSAPEKTKWLIHLGHLYGSQLGMSFAATTLQQIVSLRFQLCRSLLILVQMVQGHSFRQYLHKNRQVHLPADLSERTSHLIQCYYLLLWISQAPIHSVHFLDSVDSSVSVLKLNEVKNPLLVPQQSNIGNNITILHLFLTSSASALVRLLLSQQEIASHLLPIWKNSFLSFVQVLLQLLWPICNNTIFPEFLLLSGQHLHMQEYTRLLSKWCHSNSFTRKFLLACSLLDTGEHDKAFELFDMASHGVLVDEFIQRRVAKVTDNTDRAFVSYYTQVIKLYEQQGLHHLVVELALKAIAAAKGGEAELATLHSIAFLHQLQLGRDKPAYDALLANPDSERRKDCLQQLVVTLVDAKRLSILLEFNFDGIRRELERIIDARARSLEVAGNPYYSFAYAYHVGRGSMRKAGCVMYEQALRLSSEGSLEALQKQCQCYVAAITALSLVPAKDAWIVKPLPVDDPMDTSEDIDAFGTTKKVEVLEIKDLEKELALCKSRVRLATFLPEQTKSSSLAPHNASELVGLLTNAGLFKDALHLANLWGIPKSTVLSGLAGLCVTMDETPSDLAWDWLRENDAADLGDGSAASLSWRLLELLVMREEVPRESSLHRAVTAKLIHLGVFLPLWLIASYKKRNASELLRLLLSAGRLEEASELGIEYIEAVLGKGKDRFSLETSLLPQEPAVWLPLNTLDILLLELQAHCTADECYKEGHSRLKQLMEQYITSVKRCSDDKLKMRQDEIGRMRTIQT